MSSPFQETLIEAPPRQKIPQPALSRAAKTNLDTVIAKTGVTLDQEVNSGPTIKDAQCNPVDDYVRMQVLEALNPPLTSYTGFHDHGDESINRAPEIRRFCKAVAKMSKNGNDKTMTNLQLPPRLTFSGSDDSYIVKRELGAGAFAPVYLIEDVSQDSSQDWSVPASKTQFYALKMEEPPTPWEFYMTRLTHERLASHRAAKSIIRIPRFHLYRDECYLIEEYRDQGTLLDLVNIARADVSQPGGVMDEVVVIFFAIELFRAVEALHSNGILHGDLKGDNCLVRFEKFGDDEVWSARYAPGGENGWERKGVTLIDFGRGIDMRAFRDEVQFIADWKVGKQDCAEMRECRPWTFQIDYFGLAGVLHSLLYGRYIETVVVSDTASSEGINAGAGSKKTWRLKEGFRRYWQGDLWGEVFDMLLNPAREERLAGEEGGKMPLLKGMRRVREGMEAWLGGNCEKGVGLQGGIRRLEGLLGQARRG